MWGAHADGHVALVVSLVCVCACCGLHILLHGLWLWAGAVQMWVHQLTAAPVTQKTGLELKLKELKKLKEGRGLRREQMHAGGGLFPPPPSDRRGCTVCLLGSGANWCHWVDHQPGRSGLLQGGGGALQ